MSLQVKINSKAVRLPEGFELAINLKNNLLDGDREDATYPMEVNLASNRQVFGFVDRTHGYDGKVTGRSEFWSVSVIEWAMRVDRCRGWQRGVLHFNREKLFLGESERLDAG